MRSFLVLLGAVAAIGCAPPVRTTSINLPDGQAIFVRAVGTGQDTVLVLHHGPGLHGGYLVPMLGPLAEGRTFLIYDQRGRGRSDPALDTSRLSYSRDLEDIEAIRRHFQLNRLSLIGHGWGGALAAMYAVGHEDRVERLVLISPLFPRALHSWGVLMFPYESPDSLGLDGLDSARIAGLDTSDPRAFCLRFWGAWLSPAAVRDRATLRALRGPMCSAPPAALARVDAVSRTLMRSLGPWDLRERLRALRAPTLLVQGVGRVTRDSSTRTVWRTAAYEWTESAPNSGVVFLAAPTQFPWLGESRDFDRAVDGFLGGVWPVDARAPRSRITAK